MPEFLQNIINKIVEWWKSLSMRQRIFIISGVAVFVITIGILIFVFTRPEKYELYKAEDAVEAASVKEILDGEDIWYEQSADGLTFTIHEEDRPEATILLGSNGVTVKGYTFKDYLEGNSFSTTESDKTKKWQVYLQSKLEQDLATLSNVESAQVSFNIPKDDGTLQSSKKEASASVILELSDTMSKEQAMGIAKLIATSLGNETTENITIIDTLNNMLFSGGEELTATDIATNNLKVKREAEEITAEKVKQILSDNGTGKPLYDNVQISAELSLDFSEKTVDDYHYYVDEGMSQGYLDSRSEKSASSENGVAGVPGTDSNDDTTYVLQDGENGSSQSNEVIEDYLPSETITHTENSNGTTEYDVSHITVVAYNNVLYDEDQMKAAGQLEGTTFAEFVANNSAIVQTEVGEDLVTAISNATGIPVANVSVLAYDSPQFRYSSGGRDWTDWLEIVLAVLIFLLLGVVAFLSFRKEKQEEEVEEVSVEALLEEQEESELEDIGYTDKSEARILIEKFVDERPEAVASLLRNWLNEDWGE
ncbi:MAG: flagellar M-ring protein FliF [Lachnospiraceae bacterium]|nr:flagellar M-ring protein FliF [Lachnospiraceae bacterium]